MERYQWQLAINADTSKPDYHDVDSGFFKARNDSQAKAKAKKLCPMKTFTRGWDITSFAMHTTYYLDGNGGSHAKAMLRLHNLRYITT